MKCKRCQAKAEVQLRRHNAAFCRSCFQLYFKRQVQRSIEKEGMIGADEEVLVAVSGGKDSLALWDVLIDLGYHATGLHLALGIGEYSKASLEKTETFARQRHVRLITVKLEEEGAAVPWLAKFTRRPACAACGTAKRHHFDRVAHAQGFPVLATGHNLDDEAARLLGNVLRWQSQHLAKQHPVLQPTHERFVRKVKPLFRLSEYETAIYSFFRGIDYIIDECPNAAGASQLLFKDVLNRLESEMPGTKLAFVQEFLRVGHPAFESVVSTPPLSCERCGMPSFAGTCSYCGLLREVERKCSQREAAVPPAGRP